MSLPNLHQDIIDDMQQQNFEDEDFLDTSQQQNQEKIENNSSNQEKEQQKSTNSNQQDQQKQIGINDLPMSISMESPDPAEKLGNQLNKLQRDEILQMQIRSKSDSATEHTKLVEQVFELFFALRSNIDDSLYLQLKNKIPINESVEEVCELDVFTVFYYIRVVVDSVFKVKDEIEDELNKKIEADISDYETQLQKLEAEVRNHISIEQQLKLYFENNQQKLEESEKEKILEIEKLTEQVKNLEKENKTFKDKVQKIQSDYNSKSDQFNQISSELQKKVQEINLLEISNTDLKNQIKNNTSTNNNVQNKSMQQSVSSQNIYRKQFGIQGNNLIDPQDIISKKIQQQKQTQISNTMATNNQNTNSFQKFKKTGLKHEQDDHLYQYFQDRIMKNPTQGQEKVKKMQEILQKQKMPNTHRGDIIRTEPDQRENSIEKIGVKQQISSSNQRSQMQSQDGKRKPKKNVNNSSFNNLNKTQQIYNNNNQSFTRSTHNTTYNNTNNSFSVKQRPTANSKSSHTIKQPIKERSRTIQHNNTNIHQNTNGNIRSGVNSLEYQNNIQLLNRKKQGSFYEKSPGKSYRNNSQNINNSGIQHNDSQVVKKKKKIQNLSNQH